MRKEYIHKQPKKSKAYNFFDELDYDFRDTDEFKDYCAKVRNVLTDDLITVGEIKRRLGTDLQDNILQEALDWLKRSGLAVGTEGEFLDRWCWSEPEKKVKEKLEPYRQTHTKLFTKGKKAGEYPRNSSIYGSAAIYD